VACAGLHSPDEITAHGYLAVIPDPMSRFMKDNFAELLNAASDSHVI
jgi:hypothetical protein